MGDSKGRPQTATGPYRTFLTHLGDRKSRPYAKDKRLKIQNS